MDIDVEVVVASRRRRRFKNEGARQPPGSSALLAWWIHTANGVVDRDKIVYDDRPVTARFLQDESSKVVGGFDRREDALTEVGGGFWALGRVGEWKAGSYGLMPITVAIRLVGDSPNGCGQPYIHTTSKVSTQLHGRGVSNSTSY
uniref:Uncharacterized protein n=1 Tax=Oryza rufipogon TaxID=4529 RepID=A0A0E0R0B4_ORYRU